MKVSMNAYYGYTGPIADRLRLIADAGFDGTMLWWGNQFAHEIGPKERGLGLARSAGLMVENVHVDFDGANALWLSDEDSDPLMRRYMDCLNDCHTYGIPTIVMHLSSGNEPPKPNEQGLARLRQIAERAERLGVNVALENVRSMEPLLFALDRIDSPRIGICYDSGHDNAFVCTSDLLARRGARLMALHLHDNDGTDDHHLLPGHGTIDWPALAATLSKCGYEGPISLEAHDPAIGEDRQAAISYLHDAHEWAQHFAQTVSKAHA